MKRFAVVVLWCLSFAGFAYAQNSGEQLFTQYCASCHGADGAGKNGHTKHNVAAADLRSPEIQNLSNNVLFNSIGRGDGHKVYPHVFLMRGMSAQNINDVIAYIRTLKK